MAGIKKITLPKQGATFTNQVVSGIGGQPVIGHLHARGRRPPGFAVPSRVLRLAVYVIPLQRGIGHSSSQSAVQSALQAHFFNFDGANLGGFGGGHFALEAGHFMKAKCALIAQRHP